MNEIIHTTVLGGDKINWHTWSKVTLEKAKASDKPIFVFIAYSGSDGSRLMSEESFVDDDIVEIINESFVAVLVDKNIYPAVADFYIKSIRATGEAGGWPLLAFCEPTGRPYFLGTYYSATSKFGKPPFLEVCQTMARVYQSKSERVKSSCVAMLKDVENIYDSFKSGTTMDASELGESLHVGAAKKLLEFWDPVNGGFGKKPKFPFLYALSYLSKTRHIAFGEEFLFSFFYQCNQMAKGAILDSEAGGISSYSRSADWNSPVPEKSLVDQGLLLQVYSKAYELTENDTDKGRYKGVLESTLKALKETFWAENGGFYHYVSQELEGRTTPKICFSNAAALLGLTTLSDVLPSTELDSFIEEVFDWNTSAFLSAGGNLLRVSGEGFEGMCGDYGAFIEMCLKMSGRKGRFRGALDLAKTLGEAMVSKFVSSEHGAMSIEPLAENSLLPIAPMSYEDEEHPSDIAYGLKALMGLARHTGNDRYSSWIEGYLCSKADLARQRPLQMTHVLDTALEFYYESHA